ncbi:patatin-like phospholipase family protein [Sphingomonas sp. PAMC 26605]|uniref:patatin-like phospholipase family protein n=1 Tax=Sphingomonas sp. PAMC 26605 TaxID=1112214 RepID=UPI00026CD192|nr:patatin-like phospholipase family protein [Sphingomonas sp. PAMC 26605]
MRTWISVWTTILAAACLGACSLPRPAARAGCDFAATPIRVSEIDAHAIATARSRGLAPEPAQDDFAAAMRAAVQRRPQTPLLTAQPDGDRYLILSGGSQHGAFGAGLFYAMAQHGGIPEYKIVTGVSTGALQSTFLFLANQETGGGTYGWVDGPMAGVVTPGQSNPGDLVLAYSIASEGDLLKPTGGGGLLAALRHGSTDTFAPLRARLEAAITPKLLREVGEQYLAGRSLFIGVGNVDDGTGYAIDLTRLAQRTLSPGADVTLIKGCYIDALLASSSVPPGVPPVSLQFAGTDPAAADLFVDGGTRDGVFVQDALAGLEGRAEGGRVTVIVNGALYQAPWLEKGERVRKWSAVTLGLRAVDMLENQVYRFSVAQAEQFGVAKGGLLMAYIGTEGLAPGAEPPGAHLFRGKSCDAWSQQDSAAGAQQFHPNYMACLIDYGEQRGAGGAGGVWNHDIARPLMVAAP